MRGRRAERGQSGRETISDFMLQGAITEMRYDIKQDVFTSLVTCQDKFASKREGFCPSRFKHYWVARLHQDFLLFFFCNLDSIIKKYTLKKKLWLGILNKKTWIYFDWGWKLSFIYLHASSYGSTHKGLCMHGTYYRLNRNERTCINVIQMKNQTTNENNLLQVQAFEII